MTRAVFPGTFDPVHYGHIDIARRAAPLFDELIVAVYDRPLKSLLFTPEQRMQLVQETFAEDKRIRVTMFGGLIVEYCRKVDAQVIVRGLRVFSDFEHEFRMALANHRLAPEIEVVAFITHEEHSFLTGSTVREIASLDGDVSSMVPEHVAAALERRFLEVGNDAVYMTSLRD
ncbi:MAG: pantetheine-phosphate adenylyltransferase [Chloroflexi bacterium]|nr:pantetheine-phosphate adenylyltransferase [Chloroflexota bacterium]TDI86822.1 MAG: pantetheine-phosphate adenylyltransferase [Chloroflexota bacterium]